MAPEAQIPVAAAAQHLGGFGKHSQAMHSGRMIPSLSVCTARPHSVCVLMCDSVHMSTICCDVKTRNTLQQGLHLQMSWQGQDEEGRPMLVVHLGRLCNECQSQELAQQAADALISQVGQP